VTTEARTFATTAGTERLFSDEPRVPDDAPNARLGRTNEVMKLAIPSNGKRRRVALSGRIGSTSFSHNRSPRKSREKTG
jgi:hypothetical protein